MSYVTIDQLAKHAGKNRSSVSRALKTAQVPLEKYPGVKGKRLQVRTANRFLARQWPGVPLLPTD